MTTRDYDFNNITRTVRKQDYVFGNETPAFEN